MSNRECRDIRADACPLTNSYVRASLLRIGRTMRFLVTMPFLLVVLLVSLIETSSAADGFGYFEILPMKCIPRDDPVCKRAIALVASVSVETSQFLASAELNHMPTVRTRTPRRTLEFSIAASMCQTLVA